MINKSSLIFIFLALFSGCSDSKKNRFVQINGRTMGTTYSVKYSGVAEPSPEAVSNSIEKLLKEFNLVCSTYISESEISKLNRPGLFSSSISAEFVYLFNSGKALSEKTLGSFDPSIGPLVNLWGFGPKKSRGTPDQEDIKRAKESVGLQHFSLLKNNLLTKNNANSYLDFSAFAKGRGVDIIFGYLESIGSVDIFVEIGGEIRVKGINKVWGLGIERPRVDNKKSAIKVVRFKNGSLATSGDYRNFYKENGGKVLSHGINFSSGGPKENTTASVTVYDPENCMSADAWATALMVIDIEEALRLANKNNVAAYFIYKDDVGNKGYVVKESRAWATLFKKDVKGTQK